VHGLDRVLRRAAASGGTVIAVRPMTRMNLALANRTDFGSLPRGGLIIDQRWLLEEPLGAGGMGEVWRARDLERQSHVAVKLLAPRFLSSDSLDTYVASFYREASLARRIDCAHAVRVMECDYSPDHGPYIVMEMLAGLDLFEYLARSGTLEIAKTATIVAQLCLALEALHAADVFHRDVKPENIVMTTRNGRPCATLVDFSIARDGRSRCAAPEEGIYGTPAYLSPEGLEGSPGGTAADLWALAVVAYQCLVGRVPFDDKSLATVCVAIQRGTFSPPSAFSTRVSAGIDAWFQRAFARAPADRFASATEMREALIDAWSPFALELPSSSGVRQTVSGSDDRASGVRSRGDYRKGSGRGEAAVFGLAAARGRRITKVVVPSTECASSVPPCESTIWRAM
jgi:serine/threonine protein kinase